MKLSRRKAGAWLLVTAMFFSASALEDATVKDPLPIQKIRVELVIVLLSVIGATFCLLDRRPAAE
jgi:hypothetical protein